MKRLLFAITVGIAVIFNIAAISELGESAVAVTTLDGLRTAVAWSFAWFQAGGNMIARLGWDQSVTAWATERASR